LATSILPEWAQWIAALAPATSGVITAIIAIVVAVVSYRQWRTAQRKLQLDLFEKRFAVFMDARKVISELTQLGKVTDDGLPNEIIARAKFLFGPEVEALLSELHSLNTEYVVNQGCRADADGLLRRLTAAMGPYLNARWRA
jgi:hypothetical protein